MRELAELLLDAPAGIKLYCPAWGEVVFQGISDDINVLTDKGEFDGYGRMDPNGECLLFPSKDRHDWEEWQEDLFRPNDVVSCDEGVFIYVGTVHYNVLSTYNMTAADGKQLLLRLLTGNSCCCLSRNASSQRQGRPRNSSRP